MQKQNIDDSLRAARIQENKQSQNGELISWIQLYL